MTKKIAVINDLSGFGRCSLTAAISVISAMGIQACPLPTAILTAQTGYPHYYLDDYTDKMDIYRQEWQKMGQHFDGIYTGFVASEAQIDQIFHFIDTFYTSDTFLLVDPVMGDDGIKYDMFTPKLLEKMNALVGEADIITPNLTELCLLTDADYDAIIDIADTRILIDVIGELASTLLPPDSDNSNTLDSRQTSKKEKEIIVTGIHCKNEHGQKMMGNLYVSKDTRTCRRQLFRNRRPLRFLHCSRKVSWRWYSRTDPVIRNIFRTGNQRFRRRKCTLSRRNKL